MTLGMAVALAYGLAWIPLFVFRAEAVGESLLRYQGIERVWVRLTPFVLTAHISACCLTLNVASHLSLTGLAAAAAAFVAALGFWFWGRSQIGPLRETRLPDEPPLRFRRDGAFGLVRHPLYSSYLLACSAPLLVVPRWYLGATFAACAFAIAKRAGQEEIRLHEQLGAAYADYCGEVKRLVPFVW